MPTIQDRLPDGSHRFILQPNGSLTSPQAKCFLWLSAIPLAAIALLFSLQGFWPILPFAGLEIVVMVWALRASMRDSRQRETILVSEDRICIECQGSRAGLRMEFLRHWARVSLRRASARNHPSPLVVESHGRACEIGRFLCEDERHALADKLHRAVGGVNTSPPLA